MTPTVARSTRDRIDSGADGGQFALGAWRRAGREEPGGLGARVLETGAGRTGHEMASHSPRLRELPRIVCLMPDAFSALPSSSPSALCVCQRVEATLWPT